MNYVLKVSIVFNLLFHIYIERETFLYFIIPLSASYFRHTVFNLDSFAKENYYFSEIFTLN